MNTPCNSRKQPWLGVQCPFQYGSNISFQVLFKKTKQNNQPTHPHPPQKKPKPKKPNLCYSYQPFEKSSSQLPWSLGLNFFFFLFLWGKVDFYARLTKVLLFFDLQSRPQFWLEKGKIIHQGAPNLTAAKKTWVSKVSPISFSVGTSRN